MHVENIIIIEQTNQLIYSTIYLLISIKKLDKKKQSLWKIYYKNHKLLCTTFFQTKV